MQGRTTSRVVLHRRPRPAPYGRHRVCIPPDPTRAPHCSVHRTATLRWGVSSREGGVAGGGAPPSRRIHSRRRCSPPPAGHWGEPRASRWSGRGVHRFVTPFKVAVTARRRGRSGRHGHLRTGDERTVAYLCCLGRAHLWFVLLHRRGHRQALGRRQLLAPLHLARYLVHIRSALPVAPRTATVAPLAAAEGGCGVRRAPVFNAGVHVGGARDILRAPGMSMSGAVTPPRGLPAR